MVNICLISDFFFPSIGGVESHIYFLAYCLRSKGHKVIVLSINRPEKNITGIRYYSNGIKAYHLPVKATKLGPGHILFPTLTGSLLLLIRNILIRENIELVHGHQGTSTLGILGIFAATNINIPYVLTDHSLFDFKAISDIHINNLYQFFCKVFISKIICVSNAVRENFILRSECDAKKTCVIPNALDSVFFRKRELTSDLIKKKNKVRIVVLSRMTFRKGMDLLMELLPVICKKYKNVEFLLCGGGDKKSLLINLVKDFKIESQVKFLGFEKYEKVPQILSSGDIFLNPSVSEAFCIAILEAAACGAYVLSTNVGGISEILPEDFLTLSEPNSEDLIKNLVKILDEKTFLKKKDYNKFISEYYNWYRVSDKTLKVYKEVLKEYKGVTMFSVLKNTFVYGKVSYLLLSIFFCLNMLIVFIYSLFVPKENIQKAKDLPMDFDS